MRIQPADCAGRCVVSYERDTGTVRKGKSVRSDSTAREMERVLAVGSVASAPLSLGGRTLLNTTPELCDADGWQLLRFPERAVILSQRRVARGSCQTDRELAIDVRFEHARRDHPTRR